MISTQDATGVGTRTVDHASLAVSTAFSHRSVAIQARSDEDAWPVMISLLGNFRLMQRGQRLPIRAGGKRELLLAHLALQYGRRVPRERLATVLWPSSDLALGLHSLNNLIYSLNKLLGQALRPAVPVLHEDGYYRLNSEVGIGVDVACFDTLARTGEQHLRSGDAATAFDAFRRAAELYRGDLCIAFDAHTVVERERLRVHYLTLLARLADYLCNAGAYSESLEYLWRLLAGDPYREDAHRLVMRCHVRRGERAAALRQYQVCTEVLHEGFGAAPEAATIALFEQIRDRPETV